ncbi:MAG: HAD-IA family hydrolase [Phycisphaerales bacterium]|nr:HAD-IA family hydrolase [Hyphomonadaceae bacterium]
MTKAIIFDLDGTLIDGAEDLQAAANALLATDGLAAIDLATIKTFIGNGMGALVERCYALRGASGLDLAVRSQSFTRIYDAQGRPRTRLFPGVQAALERLCAGYRLALCTNKDSAQTLAILRELKLDDVFACVIAGDTLATKKPDPEMLRAAAAGCGAGLRSIVYVGDSEIDAQMCRAAGAAFFLFEGGYRKDSIEAIAPEVSFADYAKLPDLITGWPLGID